MKSISLLSALLFLAACASSPEKEAGQGIDISGKYPQYWSYRGEPVLLLGGSDEDNLFQMPGLEEQLVLLHSVGGNYVRNTMSSRDSGNVWPFAHDAGGGLYDLNTWNPEYWERFDKLLRLTSEREIIVQVEIWATFDFYRDNWEVNPFNPKNNMNYTSRRTHLPEVVDSHPVYCENPFFRSIPGQDNNMALLKYQQAFVDQLLFYSLKYDHVLYCIDNETSVTASWGAFWSDYIRKCAREQGKIIHVTEMWDPHDLDHISHRETFDHPELYAFVEISQNNHQRGEAHWDNGLRQIRRLENSGNLRPVNNVKTYGADGGTHGGGTGNGIQSFVRSSLFGSAAVRFHRPTSGLGLGDTAQKVIRGLREATGRLDFFRAAPHNELLSGRQDNEAYCRAIPGEAYLVYFTGPGEVELKLRGNASACKVEQMSLLEGSMEEARVVAGSGTLVLESKEEHFIYLIQEQ